jgi:hypothetical protein
MIPTPLQSWQLVSTPGPIVVHIQVEDPYARPISLRPSRNSHARPPVSTTSSTCVESLQLLQTPGPIAATPVNFWSNRSNSCELLVQSRRIAQSGAVTQVMSGEAVARNRWSGVGSSQDGGGSQRSKGKRKRGLDRRRKRHRILDHMQDAACDKKVVALLAEIPTIPLSSMPAAIDVVRPEAYHVKQQKDILRACLRRILRFDKPVDCAHEPRDEQVDALHSMVFEKKDLLLVARTGFGKSIIFQAFSILARAITLQIIPLSKLGEQQVEDIRRLEGTRPCLLSYESKRAEKKLLDQIEEGQYTHVLLGPEQASSRPFRKILCNAAFRSRVGLVAIDECHLVEQWATFRPEFTMLYEVRQLLGSDVVWFACSATLTKAGEKIVIEKTGFRRRCMRYIRTTIDRPDLTLSLHPIQKGKLSTYEQLYFLLDNAVGPRGQILAQQVPKTVIFIDGRSKITAAMLYLRLCIFNLVKERAVDAEDAATITAVTDIIQEFTARVAIHDRTVRWEKFVRPDSPIRIIIATTVLGTGVNISDIDRVVVWNFPLDRTLSELWQRLGRGGRAPGRMSKAYVFLPYWVFDKLGHNPTKMPVILRSVPRPGRKQSKALGPSRLQQSFTPGDVSDAESVGSQDESQEHGQADCSEQSIPGKVTWTVSDISRRATLLEDNPEWSAMVNCNCHREAILKHLGEIDYSSHRVPAVVCCSACNPLIHPVMASAPPQPARLVRPKGNTIAGVALQYIEQWARDRVEEVYASVDRRCALPAYALLPVEDGWHLAWLFHAQLYTVAHLKDFADLVCLIPSLQSWEFKDRFGEQLVQWLLQERRGICERFHIVRANEKDKRNATRDKSLGQSTQAAASAMLHTSLPSSVPVPTSSGLARMASASPVLAAMTPASPFLAATTPASPVLASPWLAPATPVSPALLSSPAPRTPCLASPVASNSVSSAGKRKRAGTQTPRTPIAGRSPFDAILDSSLNRRSARVRTPTWKKADTQETID